MGFRTIFVKVVLENPLETILFMVIPLVFYTSSAFNAIYLLCIAFNNP